MRWFIIRTIWFREMRDQLRDRRTLLVILGLPLILYPMLGFAVLQFATGFTEKASDIGVVVGPGGSKDFPVRQPADAGRSVLPMLSWLTVTPLPGADMAQWCGACALAQASQAHFDYPYLIQSGHWVTFESKNAPSLAREKILRDHLQLRFLDKLDPGWQDERKVDLVLETTADFFSNLDQGEETGPILQPVIQLHTKPGDDRSRLALRRLAPLLEGWKHDLRKVRLARKGLTEQYLDPFEIRQPAEASGASDNVIALVVRIFPFMLVMWSLAGALYPAVDLCAGEKERGTMETLLITPAGREEIVLGKFLTIWVFSSATALLNLLSMGITTAQFSTYMPHGGISTGALLWCVVLSLPQAAFFSALSLAIGAYARSTKEGQYYLMPLFVLTMPLIFLTLAPGVTLNPLYSMVPVTGVALLMQRLMTSANLNDIPWAYFVPVLAPIGLYSWLALRWAIEQFNREEVLFREAEHLDPLLWLRRLFREKEPTPTTGQAFFCLAMLIGLSWLTLGMGSGWKLETRTVIRQLGLVATPPIFMAVLLNTQPMQGLYLRWPRGRETGLAIVLALLLLPVMTGFTQGVAAWFPHLLEGIQAIHPLIEILRAIRAGSDLDASQLINYVLAFAVVPAICEEVAFRGFVLRGLHHGFRPRNAVLLSSFFFALFHLNVFLFLPTFLLGVVLGLLTVRSRSLFPAIAFHLLHNSVLIALIPLGQYSDEWLPRLVRDAGPWLIALCVLAAAALVWWLYRKPYVDLARQEARDRREE